MGIDGLRQRIMNRRLGFFAAISMAVAGCTSSSSNNAAVLAGSGVTQLVVCHGFDCRNRTTLALGGADARKFASIMSGSSSAAAERTAIGRAIAYFEQRSTQAVGVKDEPKSDISQSGRRGQMDCIDESTNSRTLLRYLESRGLLKFHKVLGNVSRGFFADGRYPHSTAVVQDASGEKWAVDSWYEPAGGTPDIMLLSQWLKRGVMGVR